jgi:hypothetical protein
MHKRHPNTPNVTLASDGFPPAPTYRSWKVGCGAAAVSVAPTGCRPKRYPEYHVEAVEPRITASKRRAEWENLIAPGAW